MIKIKYSSVDGRGSKWRSFKTLGRARVFAQYWVGKNPDIGSTCAVSGDGIGKIEVQGAKLADLFGDEKKAGLKPKLKSRNPRRTRKAHAAPTTSSRTRRPPMTSFHLSCQTRATERRSHRENVGRRPIACRKSRLPL